MSYRLAIFDFDGTLADSFPFLLSVFNRIADEHGFKRIDVTQIERLRHYGTREMMRHVGMPAWKLPLAAASFKTLMRENAGQVRLFPVTAPHPIRARDIEAMTQTGSERYIAPELIYLAVSSKIEPVGPSPSLHPETPVATPDGYRPIGGLQRGDLVTTPTGAVVPVLHALHRHVPALGGHAPLRLRAPYFGLRRDITVSPAQKFVLSGSEVEYLFGKESVLIQAGHLAGGPSVRPTLSPRFTQYSQVLLPENEMLETVGSIAESQFIGRIRRKPVELAASMLGSVDRQGLPEHRPPSFPVLREFDALVLAEHRAA